MGDIAAAKPPHLLRHPANQLPLRPLPGPPRFHLLLSFGEGLSQPLLTSV